MFSVAISFDQMLNVILWGVLAVLAVFVGGVDVGSTFFG